MALTSKITPYNPTWPARFLADMPLIASAFGDELIARPIKVPCWPQMGQHPL